MRASLLVLSRWALVVVIGALFEVPLMCEAFGVLPTIHNKHSRVSSSRPLISSRMWTKNIDNNNENNNNNNNNKDDVLDAKNKPPIAVWKYNVASKQWDKQEYEESVTFRELPLPVQQTWAWCRHFVLPLQLCPWARASLETPQAFQIFLVEEVDDYNMIENVADSQAVYDSLLDDVGRRFEDFLEEQQPESSMESAAIFFVVFVESASSSSSSSSEKERRSPMKDFGDFYDWFCRFEETWELLDTVIVAPFHPNWSFAGEAESLSFEKRSPYPTVTMVSAQVVDAAGEAATEQIGKHNEQVLLSKTTEELQGLWNRCLRDTNNNADDGEEDRHTSRGDWQ
jgi:hypothetical protein